MDVYYVVKDLCEKKGITIAELERSSGLGNGTIGSWKTSAPRLNSLEKAAKALGYSVTYILDQVITTT